MFGDEKPKKFTKHQLIDMAKAIAPVVKKRMPVAENKNYTSGVKITVHIMFGVIFLCVVFIICFVNKCIQQSEFFASLHREDAKSVAKYLRNGADPNVCTPLSSSGSFWSDLKYIITKLERPESASRCITTEPAIFVAIKNSDDAAVKVLVDAGANVNKQSFDGTTAPMVAVETLLDTFPDQEDLQAKRSSILECLLTHGADVNIKNDNGADVLAVAETDGKIASLLLDHGARPQPGDKNWGGEMLIVASAGEDLDLMSKLIAKGANINYQGVDGRSALMNTSSPQSIHFLIQHGADLTLRDKNGSTALDHMRYSPCDEGYEIIKAELDKRHITYTVIESDKYGPAR